MRFERFESERAPGGSRSPKARAGRRNDGFTLIELMITLVVFTVIAGSIAALVGKSQSIFRTQQGVSEMDQNARLMMDFLTRDIQQARENAAGLGNGFRPIFS